NPLRITPLNTDRYHIPLLRLAGVLLLLSVVVFSGAWIARGTIDRQGLILPQPPVTVTPSTCSQTITTLSDSGPGSLRQALHDLPQGQSCLLSFASSLHEEDLILAEPLTIDRNVIIKALDKSQITITPKSPKVAITIEPGYKVTFQ